MEGVRETHFVSDNDGVDNVAMFGENGSHCCDLLVIHRLVSGEIGADDGAHPITLTKTENRLHMDIPSLVRSVPASLVVPSVLG